MLFNPSGRISLVPGKIITIIETQVVQIFFQTPFCYPPIKIQLFHIIGGNKDHLAPQDPILLLMGVNLFLETP